MGTTDDPTNHCDAFDIVFFDEGQNLAVDCSIEAHILSSDEPTAHFNDLILAVNDSNGDFGGSLVVGTIVRNCTNGITFWLVGKPVVKESLSVFSSVHLGASSWTSAAPSVSRISFH